MPRTMASRAGGTVLYALLDPEVAPRGDVLALAHAVVNGGAAWVQLRAKRLPDGETLALARALRALTLGRAQLWVNDRADIAVLCDADGLHVGQEDLPVGEARRVLRPGQRIGVSTHDLGQVRGAVAAGADVVAFGPVFHSGTKSGHAGVTGVDVLRDVAVLAAGRPVVAIGGITADNAGACLRAGASHVAVIGALAHAADPEQAARALAQEPR